MNTTKLKTYSRYYAKSFVPAKVLQARLHKRVYTQFAEKTGLVYFGYVDQRDDEHKLVRGFTVSAQHRDNNYCIGSYKGYDITLVERTDTIHFPGKAPRSQEWIIMAFDLHTHTDIPHIFVGLHTHSDTFYANLFTKFSTLMKAPMGTFSGYGAKFTDRYAVYTEPAQALIAEQMITPTIADTMADHFGTLTAEVTEGCLYIYAWHQRPTQAMLIKMLNNGLWLASSIDAAAEHL